jgi:hypothetical protein
MKYLSVVGKGFHTEEKVVGLYPNGEWIMLWGARGAFWGGLWGLFMTLPVIGHVIVLGYLATMAVSAVESAIVIGGTSALGAALYGLGIPPESVIQYEYSIKNDCFLVMAHGSADEMVRAREILNATKPSRLDLHTNANTENRTDNVVMRVSDIPERRQGAESDIPWGI